MGGVGWAGALWQRPGVWHLRPSGPICQQTPPSAVDRQPFGKGRKEPVTMSPWPAQQYRKRVCACIIALCPTHPPHAEQQAICATLQVHHHNNCNCGVGGPRHKGTDCAQAQAQTRFSLSTHRDHKCTCHAASCQAELHGRWWHCVEAAHDTWSCVHLLGLAAAHAPPAGAGWGGGGNEMKQPGHNTSQ